MSFGSKESKKGIRKWIKRAKRDAQRLCKEKGLGEEYVFRIVRDLVEERANIALEQAFREQSDLSEEEKQQVRHLCFDFYYQVLDEVLRKM